MITAAQPQPAINSKALAWTVGVHALLLLLFFLWRYTIPLSIVTDPGGGLEVNLGTSDNGSGTDQPMSVKDPAAYQASVVYKSVSAKSVLPKDMMKSTDADAPTVDKEHKKNGQAPNDEKGHKQEQPKYTYAGDKGAGGNSASQDVKGTSEGITHGKGDQGVPGGTPGAANYTGTPGNGNGGIISLPGRQITPNQFDAEFNEGGKVIIHVTVDKNGNIIYTRLVSSSNSQLTKIAMDKLSKAYFSKSDVPEQSGDITINFKTHQ